MIYTVFTLPAEPTLQWHADLLEYSWQRVRQPGELVRLTPTLPDQSLPAHGKARVVATMSWNPHPYTDDTYEGYDAPMAVLEWLFANKIEGTILLLEPRSILRSPVSEEVVPGSALAAPWSDLPTGEGPFGLASHLQFLECYCVNRTLKVAPVRMPLLVHSSDLRKIAPRWGELTAIIRAEGKDLHGKLRYADRLAYTIAAAEYRLVHAHHSLCSGTADEKVDAPIIDYSRPIEASSGEIVWDERVYEPWNTVFPEKARPGVGRDFLARLNELATRTQSGADLASKRPQRCGGVREARLLDEMRLEIPGCTEFVTLNSSAAAIWELCDGTRNLAEVVGELERRFDAPRDALRNAVRSTTIELAAAGALELEEIC